MFSTREEEGFISSVIDSRTLSNSIDWIRYNLTPDTVFTQEDLEEWAEENGYVKEEV